MIARYTRPELARLWSDDHRFDIWLRVELAACEEMEAAGSVPRGTAAAVAAKAEGKLDPARILEHEERTRHDVIAFLTHVEELAGEPARWLHLGMTSSDVLDAALAVQLCEATDQILEGIDKLRAACRRRADEQRATPAIGRSHGIHAEPITAGLVFAGFFAELGRARRALVSARAEIAVGKIAGAVGTYANLDPAIEAGALARARPAPRGRSRRRSSRAIATPPTSRRWRASARRSSASRSPCATGSAPRSARRRRPSARGRRAPRRCRTRRTRSCRRTCAGSRACCAATRRRRLENVALWHERDISHSSVERVIGPDATGLADFMVRRAAGLVDGLVVNRDRMRRNLDLTGGLFFSEAVLLSLVRKGMARQAAYELVQRNALRAAAQLGARSPRRRAFACCSPRIPTSPPG